MFDEFKSFINEGKFFEAHEIIEEYWQTIRKTNHPFKNAYRGFINAAVSLELKKRGRKSYKRVWETYEKYKFLYFQKDEFIEIMKFLDSKKPF